MIVGYVIPAFYVSGIHRKSHLSFNIGNYFDSYHSMASAMAGECPGGSNQAGVVRGGDEKKGEDLPRKQGSPLQAGLGSRSSGG